MVAFKIKECFNFGMKKSEATRLLGGSTAAAAQAMAITPQAYYQWPEELPPRLQDRVVAAIARKHLPAELFGETKRSEDGKISQREAV